MIGNCQMIRPTNPVAGPQSRAAAKDEPPTTAQLHGHFATQPCAGYGCAGKDSCCSAIVCHNSSKSWVSWPPGEAGH